MTVVFSFKLIDKRRPGRWYGLILVVGLMLLPGCYTRFNRPPLPSLSLLNPPRPMVPK